MNLLGTTRDRQTIKNVILNLAQKRKQVVYGGQASNIQLPSHLQRKTSDFDILTKQPKKSAEELVRALNREYQSNKFKVVPATYKKTFKVKEIETGETIADYTSTTKLPTTYKELGIDYARLQYIRGKLRDALKKPENEFRFEKDRNTLERIKQGGI